MHHKYSFTGKRSNLACVVTSSSLCSSTSGHMQWHGDSKFHLPFPHCLCQEWKKSIYLTRTRNVPVHTLYVAAGFACFFSLVNGLLQCLSVAELQHG